MSITISPSTDALPIAIAAAAKNDNQAMRFDFPQSFKNIPERIRCVRVIDRKLEIVASPETNSKRPGTCGDLPRPRTRVA